MKKSLFKIIIAVAIITVIGVFSSCKKDTDCKAIIKVVNFQELPIPGSQVILYIDRGGEKEIKAQKTTNSSGTCEFTFPLEVIYNIEAVKDSIIGTGIVRFIAGEEVKKNVYIDYTFPVIPTDTIE